MLFLWLFSSGKTQKIGCIYRIWVLKFIRASLQEWRFLNNRSSDHDVSHIKQNYPIFSRCYKRPLVDIFICVAKKLNWNRGILNDHPVYPWEKTTVGKIIFWNQLIILEFCVLSRTHTWTSPFFLTFFFPTLHYILGSLQP